MKIPFWLQGGLACGCLNVMSTQPKRMIGLILGGALMLALSGCSENRAWSQGDWTPAYTLDLSNNQSNPALNRSRSSRERLSTNSGRSSAGFLAHSDPHNQYGHEYDRRDGSMSIADNDPTAGYLGFPEQQRASLEHQRTFRTGKNADRFVFPTTNSYSGRRSYRRYRSYR
jgi:hypothetical protein